ncbi:MAG TPA: NADH-quinone oxidoreductase subunit A [Microscillaceae bacterium]|nr:NADH-quinone oxidoreductase subunit A [Microscillaceae bacterium]
MLSNPQVSAFGFVLLFIIGAVAFALIGLWVASFIRPARPNPEKLARYECGEEPLGSTWGQFNIRFYVIALIFILFEVELVLLFPWAVVYADPQLMALSGGVWMRFALIEGFVFVAILAIGLAYAWRNGYLDWVKPAPQPSDFSSPVPTHLYEAFNQHQSEYTVVKEAPPSTLVS